MTSDPTSTPAQILRATTLASTRLSGHHLPQCGLAIVKVWPALRWPSTLNIPCRIAQVSRLVALDSRLIALGSKTKRKNPRLLLSVLLDLQVDRLQMVVLQHGFKSLVVTFSL